MVPWKKWFTTSYVVNIIHIFNSKKKNNWILKIVNLVTYIVVKVLKLHKLLFYGKIVCCISLKKIKMKHWFLSIILKGDINLTLEGKVKSYVDILLNNKWVNKKKYFSTIFCQKVKKFLKIFHIMLFWNMYTLSIFVSFLKTFTLKQIIKCYEIFIKFHGFHFFFRTLNVLYLVHTHKA